mmetsp:Transcript_12533/g.26762  ORF Transcript_12533/g.26762 Transcript_12533/m.26762 type:complete len:227 (+) Transcript_12533:152-832(+)
MRPILARREDTVPPLIRMHVFMHELPDLALERRRALRLFAKFLRLRLELLHVLVRLRESVRTDCAHQASLLLKEREKVLVQVANHVAVRVDLDHVRVAIVVQYNVWLEEEDALVLDALALDRVVNMQDRVAREQHELNELEFDRGPGDVLPKLLADGVHRSPPLGHVRPSRVRTQHVRARVREALERPWHEHVYALLFGIDNVLAELPLRHLRDARLEQVHSERVE